MIRRCADGMAWGRMGLLSAAAIQVHGNRHPLPIVALANELLALWDRPPINKTVLEGRLDPVG
jgi:hypothetical protein